MKNEKIIIGNFLQTTLSFGYQVQINYRATKERIKGPARDAEIVKVTNAQDFSRCTWGRHINCSVSQRLIVNIVPGFITLQSYCKYGKEKAYDFLYDENGKHVTNVKVRFTIITANIPNNIPH